MKQKVKQSGFTLAEIAIVLAIIGIAMTMGLKMLTATLENGAISETKAKQERIKLALVSFMRSNGRLPCPDTTAAPAAPTGLETTPCTTAAFATNPAAGSGVVPWLTLGLAREAVLDGWNNYFTYRVANFRPIDPPTSVTTGSVSPPLHLYNNHNWTTNAGFDIRSLTPTPVASAPTPAASSYATLSSEHVTPGAALSDEARNAVAVILSHGKNGLGARTVRAVAVAPLPTASAAADELTTGTVGSKIFVKRQSTT